MWKIIYVLIFTAITFFYRVLAQCQLPPSSLPVNGTWLEKSLRNGMYIPLQSKLEKFNPLPNFPKNENFKKRQKHDCFELGIKINDPPANKTMIGASFYYDTLGGNHFFIIDTPKDGHPLFKRFQYFGEFSLMKTDNKTFVSYFGCLYGDSYYRSGFLVFSLTPSMPEAVKQDIVKKGEDLGLDPFNVNDGKDAFVFQTIRQSPLCGVPDFRAGFGEAVDLAGQIFGRFG